MASLLRVVPLAEIPLISRSGAAAARTALALACPWLYALHVRRERDRYRQWWAAQVRLTAEHSDRADQAEARLSEFQSADGTPLVVR